MNAAAAEGIQIGRRGFVGAGLATAATALAAPANVLAANRSGHAAGTAGRSDTPPAAGSLLPIPRSRVRASVKALDRIVADARSRTGVPGIACAVVHEGRLLYAKGFGVRDMRTRTRVTEHTVFRLASVSKSLSSTVVAGIVGRKLARWDDTVITHLPEFALGDPYVTSHITIADLFCHRSGLPSFAGDLLEDLDYTQHDILRALRLEPLSPFRATYAYTNFGLTAAAVAAAAATGRSWPDIADEILFDAIGMTTASFRHADFARRANRAEMHVRIDGSWHQRYHRNADPEAPASGASAGVLDMAKWMALVLADGARGGREVIDAGALRDAHLPRIVAAPPSTPAGRAGFYGFGTNVGYDASGRVRLGHSGAFLQGVSTNYTLLPAERLGIVALTNGMPIGVPETVTSSFLDLVVAGSIQRDWLKQYEPVFAHLYVNPSELAGKPRPAHPAPARETAFYAGTYDNDYYGQIQIVADGSTLRLLIGPRPTEYPLDHWDGDTFAFFPTGENAVGITAATFTGDTASGQAPSVRLEYYDANGLGTFTRAAP